MRFTKKSWMVILGIVCGVVYLTDEAFEQGALHATDRFGKAFLEHKSGETDSEAMNLVITAMDYHIEKEEKRKGK